MKKLALSSILALSGSLAMVGCTQASAVDSQAASTTQMHQKQGMGEHHKGGQHMGNKRHHGGLEKLNLSAQQQAQIKALKRAQMEKRKAHSQQRKAQMQQMHAQTKALVNADSLDQTALNKLANQHAAMQKARFMERVAAQHAMSKILTPEQKAQLEQMQQERQQRRQGKADRHQAK